MRLAFTTLTVLPLRPGRVDRRAAAVAMTIAPLVGALLGLVLAVLLTLLDLAGAPRLVAAGLAVGAGALLTRGLHLDGLADTIDALGSYRRGAEALEIMKKPDIGPFGLNYPAARAYEPGSNTLITSWHSPGGGWTEVRDALTMGPRRGEDTV